MTVRERLNTFAMALFGPAHAGPYGPASAPPPPNPRDAHGRVISPKRIARAQATMVEVARVAAIAKATTVAGLDASRQSIDGLPLGPIPHAR
ncbi:MAG: hypothetical protein M3O28_13975 [Actinomycetota bacterium]|nr:hypothetical protein [Actinomycetota bacterium]